MTGSLLLSTERVSRRVSGWLIGWLIAQAAMMILLVGVSIGAGQWPSACCVAALVFMVLGTAAGAVLWLTAVSRNVVRQRQFRLFRQLAEHASVALAMTDMKGNLMFGNERWYDQLESPESASGSVRPTWHMGRIEEGNTQRRDLILQETLRGGFVGDVGLETSAGHSKRMLLSTSIVRDHQMPAALCWSLEDITEATEVPEDMRRLAGISAHSADAVVCTDMGGTITSWNEGAERIFGYPRNEAVGRDIDILVPEDLRHSHREAMKAKMQERGLIENIETVRVHKDGSKIPVHLIITNLEDDKGEVVGRGLTLRDISKQRELEQNLRQYVGKLEDDLKHVQRRLEDAERLHDELVPSVRDCLVMARGDSKVLEVNPSVLDALGYSVKEAQVMKLTDFHDRENGRAVNDLIGLARRNGSAQGQVEVQTRDGRNVEADIRISYYPNLDSYQAVYRLTES